MLLLDLRELLVVAVPQEIRLQGVSDLKTTKSEGRSEARDSLSLNSGAKCPDQKSTDSA